MIFDEKKFRLKVCTMGDGGGGGDVGGGVTGPSPGQSFGGITTGDPGTTGAGGIGAGGQPSATASGGAGTGDDARVPGHRANVPRLGLAAQGGFLEGGHRPRPDQALKRLISLASGIFQDA